MKKYKTILADPPWEQNLTGAYKGRHKRKRRLDYPTMSVEEIKLLPVGDFADYGCHLWLWTTNQFLFSANDVLKSWGFKYLNTITWVKPSGLGNYFSVLTQHILFGYISPLKMKERYKPNVLYARPPQNRHSRKPEECFKLIESVSFEPRLELFAREYDRLWPNRPGWDQWGNEIKNSISLIN